MNPIKLKQYLLSFSAYKIAILLSSLSVMFGIGREFLLIGLLGFSAHNDQLQVYLSIFFTIGLSIDAMRLACLNLFSLLSLPKLLFSASCISFPFAILVGITMSYFTDGLNLSLLSISIIGGYLNLIASLLITYLQRHNQFLTAQIINVLPNLVLIPGILFCWYFNFQLVFSIILLTSLIPVVQCVLLLSQHITQTTLTQSITFVASINIFLRHFLAMSGEQLFQIITRSAFYTAGTGYLTLYAIMIRIYSAIRFVLIDSFIGSKLSSWKMKSQSDFTITKLIRSTSLASLIVGVCLLLSLNPSTNLLHVSMQMSVIFCLGFYFLILVRIVYFKINHHENNSVIVMRFAAFEFLAALFAFLVTKQPGFSILSLVWIGYIAKPFFQLLMLRKKYDGFIPIKDIAS